MRPLFGPAGNSDSFAGAGHKDLNEVPAYLRAMGLDAYEYQGGHGVRISRERAERFGALAKEAGVALSIHAPYYISMSGVEEQKRDNSIGYILQSVRAACFMGAKRVVVHCGSAGKISRPQALALAKETFARALAAMDAEGLSGVYLCPETMGKVNQLGTVDEVVELCRQDERLLPCVDFGHVNARTFGALQTRDDYAAVLAAMENGLGEDRARRFHSHFSKIEYTRPGGEKCHLTFADTVFGPDFAPLAELLYQKGYAPVLICESRGTQAEDAAQMKRMYAACTEKPL